MIKKIRNLLLAAFLLPVGRLYAQTSSGNPPTLNDATNMLNSVFAIFIPVGALLAVGMMVWGGYMWIMSEGDPGKIKQAQGTLTWAVIGLVFLGIFRMILVIVFDFLGA